MNITLRYSSAQDIGSRKLQEDSVFCNMIDSTCPDNNNNKLLLSVVADGMGGHIGGEVASCLAVDCFIRYITDTTDSMGPTVLENALFAANRCLQDFVNSNTKYQGMGTTLLASCVAGNHLFYISVGDSLLYLLRNNEIRLLNDLHSCAEVYSDQAINNGLPAINTEQALSHVLTSCLNGSDIAKTDRNETPFILQSGDQIILSTDGINSLGGAEIRYLLNAENEPADKQETSTDNPAQTVINRIRQKRLSGQDNTSIIVLSAE